VNIKTDDINATRKALVVNVSADEIEKEHDSLLDEFAKQARIPGFRPGRAPKNMITQRFANQIKDELKKKVVSNAYREALKETEIQVFNLIELKGDDHLERGKENELTFVVDVHPEFNLPEYKGIPVDKPDSEVKEEEIDSTIETIRNQRADFSVVEREAQTGDYVKLSYEGKIGDQSIAELVPDRPIFGIQSSTWEEVGSEDAGIPGFAEQLAGLKAGDKKEIAVKFPDDFAEKELAGKEAVYSVEMLEVREKKLPELDEEFLNELNVKTVEELREQIRSEMAQRKESEGQSQQRKQVSDTLLSRIEFEVPDTAIEQETESILRQIVDQNLRQGVPQDELEKHKDKLYEEAQRAGVQRVKLRLILLKIAEEENIKAENEDVQRYIMREAMRSGTKPDQLVKELRKDENRVRSMQQNIVFDKTLDFLLQQATISESKT